MRIAPEHPQVLAPGKVQFGKKITEVEVGRDLPSPEAIQDELLYYCDVLLGRVPAPVSSPYLDLQELATAYFARASELDILIHWEEQNQRVMRGHPLYKIRTGQLRTFMDMAKKVADLGSRRLTQEVLLQDQRYDSGDR